MSTVNASHDPSLTAPAVIALPTTGHFTDVGEPLTPAAGEIQEMAFDVSRAKPASIDAAYAHQQMREANARTRRQYGGSITPRSFIEAAKEALAIQDEMVMYSRYSRALITTIATMDPAVGTKRP